MVKPYSAMRVGRDQLILTLHEPTEDWFEHNEDFYVVLKDDYEKKVNNWQAAFVFGIALGVLLSTFLLK
jgi:hypothetical protein